MKQRNAGMAMGLVVLAILGFAGINANERFPSSDPNPRVGTPDDPRFDCAERDNEDTGEGHDCAGKLFEQQVALFGFAPGATRNTAIYKDAARFGQGQISGVSADVAWKTTTGLAQVSVTVLDTGIRWDRTSLRRKIRLNRFELPRPQDASGATRNNAADRVWDGYDVNADGAFNVDDYADDPRVDKNGGARGVADVIDAQDLIARFSDGSDSDANGYVDDIAGWDFFEDDNDPDDTTSYSAAGNHGSGRATDAVEETNDGQGSAGVCPECQILPLRVWDTFVSPGDTYAAATAYAADLGINAQIVALGVLQNTRAAKAATTYAHNKGMALMQVSSDLNTANHNYPTNYVESVYINGCVADSHGGSSELPGLSDFVPVALNVPVLSWFRNSGLTQYGAHAHVCYVGTTGSIATGQAGGGAALIASRGIQMAEQIGGRLTTGEIKQILTLTAEDVLPENVVGIGLSDPAQAGWDEHFGYGRADLGKAVQSIQPGRIPPEALIQSPAWWAILDPVNQEDGVTIHGLANARRSTGCEFRLEYALGIEPANTAFTEFASGACPGNDNAVLGTLPLDEIADGIAGSRDGSFMSTPLTRPNPNQHTFTVRLVVTDAEGNRGEDRKAYFAHHDPTWHAGWPKFVDTGGETSPVLFDMDGDGTLEYIDANSAGELWVYHHTGEPLARFNGGKPWMLPPAFFFHADAPAFKSGAVPPVTSGFRTPSVADLDGDFEPEIVVSSADGRLYVIRNDGSVRLTLGVDLSFSTPDKRDNVNHPKRGFQASPTLADLDRDGVKEIVIAGLDGYIYAWDGKTGASKPGFPREIREEPAPENLDARGELIATVSVGNIDGDPELEIVTGSSDFLPAEAAVPTTPPPLAGGLNGLIAWVLEHTAGGQTRVYAVNHDGSYVEGWPKPITGLLGDVLPYVGPQHTTSMGDLDSDGVDDVVSSMTTGDVNIFKGDGSVAFLTSTGVVNGGVNTALPGLPAEPSRVLNLFEYTVIGNLNGIGALDVAKVGVTLPQVLNLLLVGQNFPYNHVVQAWDTSLPDFYLPGYPTAHDDYGLLTTPAIANVDGAGNAEIIAGSGLYLLHAYNSLGVDVPGFPKLTGGWIFNVPAIGDVDGDGKLNMVSGTREGYRFMWDLDADATAANNTEWWMEAHDECHSNNYGTDCRPPNRVKNLRIENGELKFTAPGDDWGQGTVHHYELRSAVQPILTLADWQAATLLPDVPGNATGGAQTSFALDASQTPAHVAISAVDEAGNRSRFVTLAMDGSTNAPAPVIVMPAAAVKRPRFGGALSWLTLFGAGMAWGLTLWRRRRA